MTKIWIDTTSGTWGEVDGDQGRLVIVDVDEQAELEQASGEAEGYDGTSIIAYLDGASDSEIMQYGMEYGRLAIPEPTDDQLERLTGRIQEAINIGANGTNAPDTARGIALHVVMDLGLR